MRRLMATYASASHLPLESVDSSQWHELINDSHQNSL